MSRTAMIDVLSLKLTGITIIGGIFLKITMLPVFGWLTAGAALSTIVYNAIKIYKELKNKP
jgi:hypothetical protein